MQAIVTKIRQEKAAGLRAKPSSTFIDKSNLLTPKKRSDLLDKIASLVDEKLGGRSEMCLQFSELLQKGLSHCGVDCRAVLGDAIYYDGSGKEFFRWRHAWVRIGDEVVDGNLLLSSLSMPVDATRVTNPAAVLC